MHMSLEPPLGKSSFYKFPYNLSGASDFYSILMADQNLRRSKRSRKSITHNTYLDTVESEQVIKHVRRSKKRQRTVETRTDNYDSLRAFILAMIKSSIPKRSSTKIVKITQMCLYDRAVVEELLGAHASAVKRSPLKVCMCFWVCCVSDLTVSVCGSWFILGCISRVFGAGEVHISILCALEKRIAMSYGCYST